MKVEIQKCYSYLSHRILHARSPLKIRSKSKRHNSILMQPVRKDSMGWLKDFADIRDFTPFTDHIPERSRKRGVQHTVKEMLSDVGFHGKGATKKSRKPKTQV